MVYYSCDRCGYSTEHRNSMRNHLYRKNICKMKYANITIEEIRERYKFLEKGIEKMNTKEDKLWVNDEKYSCNHCNKLFSRNDSLKRHLLKCKYKKDKNKIEEMEAKIIKLEEDLSKKGDTIINSNTILNNNIIINNYGNETLDYLSPEYFNKLLKSVFTSIPKLIEKIHFNPKHPENHNIKITNKKDPYIKILKNNKWYLEDKKEILGTLVDNKYYILESHYDNLDTSIKMSSKTIQRINNFIDNFSNESIHKNIEKRTELVILNNSNLIK